MVVAQPLPELTPRQKLRAWVREQIDARAEVALPALTQEVILHFSNDERFVHDFLYEMLYPIVYQIAQAEMAQTRGQVIVLGDRVVSREELAKPEARFLKWKEHVGDRHMLLVNMQKHDLLTAAEERQVDIQTQVKRRRFLLTLAKKLPDGKRVGDRYSATELKRIYDSL